jgi:hypothetical protein
VNVDLSPTLKAKIEPDVSRMGGWSKLTTVPMGLLRKELHYLSEDEFLEVMRYLVSAKNLAS